VDSLTQKNEKVKAVEKNSKVAALPYFLKHLFILSLPVAAATLLACFLLYLKKAEALFNGGVV
jgi:hypothetical protein